MDDIRIIQGRQVSAFNVDQIRLLIKQNPVWTRRRLSLELCELWQWYTSTGHLKDMSCRNLLLKLHRQGLICLPAPTRRPPQLQAKPIVEVLHSTDPIVANLSDLRPVRLIDAREQRWHQELFNCLLHRYHYLGFERPVGENFKYIAFDSLARPLGCLLFGAAAWKAKDRDSFIGWGSSCRKANLSLLTNNTRFLILPWVRVPNLASHLLSLVIKQLNSDWNTRYGHHLSLVETFVDRSRFTGTCYQAANWIYVGKTVGRSRNDRSHSIKVPVKDHYVYPLGKKFQRILK